MGKKKRDKHKINQAYCYCGKPSEYEKCCGKYHNGKLAETAETLMRSRYSAYVLKNEAYLLQTWHPDYCPERLQVEDDDTHWLGLKVIRSEQGQAADETGIVEFIARYKVNGKAHRLHEVSGFIQQKGQWFYTKPVE